MAESETSSTPVTLKLLIDTDGKRVLFAEAGKDFIDFLFRILTLPVSTVINLLKRNQMEGSLTSLYQSIENLSDAYMQHSQSKDAVLKPAVAPASGFVPLLMLEDKPSNDGSGKSFYRCSYGCGIGSNYVADDPLACCPNCRNKMTIQMKYVEGPARGKDGVGEGGYVKGVVTYMVMDDLVVTPLSTISSVTLLNKFNVKGVGSLEERVVDFGLDEAVKLLNASLKSKKVLTDVYLSKTRVA